MSGFDRGSGRGSPSDRGGYGTGDRGGYRGYGDYRGGTGRADRGGYRGRGGDTGYRGAGRMVGERGSYIGGGERGVHRGRGADRGEIGSRGAPPIRGPQLEPYVPVETFQPPPYEPLGPQDLVQALTAVDLSSDTEPVMLPIRPGLGTKGSRAVGVLTNHFRASLREEASLVHYDVAFAEADGRVIHTLPPTKARRRLSLALEQNRASIGDVSMAFDGSHSLFTTHTQRFGVQRTITGRIPRSGGPQKKDKGNVVEEQAAVLDVYQVLLRLKCEVPLRELGRCVAQRDPQAQPRPCLTALDAVLREEGLRTCIELGRRSFLCTDKQPSPVFLDDLFVAHRGYFQGLHLSQCGLTCKVDQSMVLFIREQPLTDLIARLLQRSEPLEVMDEADARTVTRLIRGLRVEAVHRPGYVSRVRGLSSLPAQRLPLHNPQDQATQTVHTYFWARYGRALRFPGLPCARVGSRHRPTYLPLEVCKVLAGQRVPPHCAPDVAQHVAQLAALPPPSLFNKITAHARQFRESGSGLTKAFGLDLLPQVLAVQGRVLDPPKICMQGLNQQLLTEQVQGGAWSFTRKLFFRPATLHRWAVLSLCPRVRLPDRDVRGLVDDLHATLDRAGVKTARPFRTYSVSDYEDEPPEALLQRVFEEMGRDVQLVLCIIDKEGDVYDRVKRSAEVGLGLMTQCLRLDTARQRDPLTLLNLAVKINNKVGGYSSVLDKGHLQYVSHGSTILMGACVLPPSPLAPGPAFAALCGSNDEHVQRHAASTRAQPPHHYHIHDMQAMAEPLLRGFSERQRSLPGRIIVYRGGLDETHYPQVLQAEVRALQAACRALRQDYSPPITYIAVHRDHHTRFFTPDTREQDGRTGNVKAGLVVDSGLTHPTGYDFFLVSHSTPLGTARPTYYRVLRDESDMGVDTLQQLTYHLCHSSARGPRAVCLPPSLHYASLAARRAHIFLDEAAIAPTGAPKESEQTEEGLEQDVAVDWQARMLPLKAPVDQTMWFL